MGEEFVAKTTKKVKGVFGKLRQKNHFKREFLWRLNWVEISQKVHAWDFLNTVMKILVPRNRNFTSFCC